MENKQPIYKDFKKLHRAACKRHVIVVETDMNETQKRRTFSKDDMLRQMGNRLTGVLQKRLDQLFRTKKYRVLLKEYGKLNEKLSGLSKDDDKYNEIMGSKKNVAAQMNDMQKQYKLTFEDALSEMRQISKGSGIYSAFCFARCEDIWKGVKKVLYGDGKHLNFLKRSEPPVIRAKEIDRGIMMKIDKNGCPRFHIGCDDEMKPIGEFGIIVPEKDRFLSDEINAMIRFWSNREENERAAVEDYIKTGNIHNTYRPCYCMIKCKVIRGKLRVFLEICLEGQAMPKYKKNGAPRHDFTKKGIVGVDIGTQSVAVCSNKKLILDNLAERNHKSTKESEAKERRLLRKMDRSRRATNPDNYNEDGTVKPFKDRKPWKYSNTYLRTRDQYRELCRKNADSRKFANQEMANTIRTLGDVLITEPKNADKLKRKAKESKVTVREDGTKKYSRRKRFGKSIQNRCPGFLQADLKKKFGEDHYCEVPYKYRASQYDHTVDNYIEKTLNTRMYDLSDGTKVQRDLYSAFLLSHPNTEGNAPDHDACLTDFKDFKTKMDALIKEIKASGRKVCNSGI